MMIERARAIGVKRCRGKQSTALIIKPLNLLVTLVALPRGDRVTRDQSAFTRPAYFQIESAMSDAIRCAASIGLSDDCLCEQACGRGGAVEVHFIKQERASHRCR